ncbi:MAG: cytochrome c3 family protein [Thermodesulfobacteriota bacterium]
MGRFCSASLFFLAATLIFCLPPAIAAEPLSTPSGSGLHHPDGGSAIPSPPLETIDNPHAMACDKCHVMGPDGKEAKELLTGNDSIKLCEGCHPDANLHPLGIEPINQFTGLDKYTLPLGAGIYQDKIVCLTCHYIHQEQFTPYLLRGDNTTHQTIRNSLCSTCHKEHFSGISPHTTETTACIFCHTASPGKRKNKGKMAHDEIDAVCIFCHWSLRKNHYKDLDPLPDPLVQELIDPASNLRPGQMYCLSCHLHHGKVDENHLITKQYLQLAAISRNINPHWKNMMCISCHKGTPSKGNPNLLGSGDLNELCNRCHKSEFARADIHPVGLAPSKQVKLPTDMPLQDGKLTCETCHQSSLQESALHIDSVGKENPNFLRRSGLSRNEFCFLCHLQETYRRLNPHLQMDEHGHIKKETCLLCHASLPDIYLFGPKNVIFIVKDPNEYCIGCHPGFSENHPAGGRHLVKPSEKILKALETSVQRIGVELPLFDGKVVCATCHNPHDEGVIKFPASAEGSQRQNKLRLKPGITQCTGCHWDKG